jgi:hypothetical protein
MDCAKRRPASCQGRLVAAAIVVSAIALLPGAILQPQPVQAQSDLLKMSQDPARSKRLCQYMRQMNQQGISYLSEQVKRQIAKEEKLGNIASKAGLRLDVAAEVLLILVAKDCPGVF